MPKVNCNKCKMKLLCKQNTGIENNDLRFTFLQIIQVTEDINLIKNLIDNFSKLRNKKILKKIKASKKHYKNCYWAT